MRETRYPTGQSIRGRKEGDQEQAKRGLRTQAGAPGAQLAVLPEQEGPRRVMKQGSRRGGGRRQQAGAHRMENEGNAGERTNESSKEAVWGAPPAQRTKVFQEQ